MSSEESFPWHLGVFDAHCHPTDTLSSLQTIPGMKANVLTVMATRAEDQALVAQAADEHGIKAEDINDAVSSWSGFHKMVPAFGWHPWFSHQMFEEASYNGASKLSQQEKVKHYQSVLTPQSEDHDFLISLPDPRPFGHFLAQTHQYLSKYPLALVGEIGLDKSFRIPETWLPEQIKGRDKGLTPGGREGRQLSPYRVSMEHQRNILLAQLRLAGAEQRAVSVHGVAAHGALYDTLAETWKNHNRPATSNRRQRKLDAVHVSGDAVEHAKLDRTQPQPSLPYPPRICLHSYSGKAETVKMYTAPSVPCDIFFSFSVTVNTWSEDGNGKVEAAVRAVPDDRLLVESDLHKAGTDMDGYLEAIVRKLCQIKGWTLQDGMKRLGENWKHFVFGRQ